MYGHKVCTLLDFEAISNVLSSMLVDQYSVVFKENKRSITVATGKHCAVVELLKGVPVSFGEGKTFLDFMVVY